MSGKERIITSLRKFGIELECVFKSQQGQRELYDKISNYFSFDGDGSIRRHKDYIGSNELISHPLAGETGEKIIRVLADNAYSCGFGVNTSCGFHLHLEAKELKRNPKNDSLERHPQLKDTVYYEIYKTDTGTTIGNYNTKYEAEYIASNNEGLGVRKKIDENKLLVNRGPEFFKLRNLFYVYVAFDDVFRGMQPPSRRKNKFCYATSSLYSINEVRDLDDYGELERMWYKPDRRRKIEDQIHSTDQRKSSSKDSSRYVGFNLEPLLRFNSSSTTIEFRYHSPTLDDEKILRWIDLHQTIMDRVIGWDIHEFPFTQIEEIVATETHLVRKAKAMATLFGIKEGTLNHIKNRIKKFNDISATEEELEDDEVEDSEVGRPYHTPSALRMRRNEADAPAPVQLRPRETRRATRGPIAGGLEWSSLINYQERPISDPNTPLDSAESGNDETTSASY